MRFKDFIVAPAKRFEDLLHHIAEEELIACKVVNIRVLGDNKVEIHADCQDVPRKSGFQPDLTQKLVQRLKLHPLQDFHLLDAKVYHHDADEFRKFGDAMERDVDAKRAAHAAKSK